MTDPLVRPPGVEVRQVLTEGGEQLSLAQNEDVVETLPTNAAHETFTACAVQRLVGARVTPTWTTRREPCSTMNNANTGRKKMSYVCRKSQAQIWFAWFFKNVDQLCPHGRGPRAERMYFWIVRLLTRMPSSSN